MDQFIVAAGGPAACVPAVSLACRMGLRRTVSALHPPARAVSTSSSASRTWWIAVTVPGSSATYVDALLAARHARVITDPNPTNARAVRAYEKAGFRRDREVDTPDGRALLMIRDNPQQLSTP